MGKFIALCKLVRNPRYRKLCYKVILFGGLSVFDVISKLRLRPFFEDLECKFNVVRLLKADRIFDCLINISQRHSLYTDEELDFLSSLKTFLSHR